MARLLRLFFALWLALGPAFAQTPVPKAPSPSSSGGALTPLSSEQHILRPGDQIELRIAALPELATTYQVRVDGYIFHPVAGEILANGKTLADLRTEITKRLAKELRNPSFRLGILEVARHQVAVLGEANSQGTFEVGVGASVLDLIAVAGGLTDKADRDRAVLLRGDEKIEVSLRPEAGGGLTKVRTGDVLYILPGSPISITGEVTKPGIYSVSRVSGGVREAILAAGGAKEEASLSRVRLIRASLPAPIVFDITPGTEKPIPLEAQQLEEGDILVVPARQAVILGSVGAPGPVPLRGGETLLDIIPSRISGDSDITKIMVIRAENVKENRDKTEEYNLKEYFEEGKADALIPIYDGDIVYVPAKGKGGFLNNILNVIGIGRSFLFF